MGTCLGHLQTDFCDLREFNIINNFEERYKKNYECLEYGFKTMLNYGALRFDDIDILTNLYDLLRIFRITPLDI